MIKEPRLLKTPNSPQWQRFCNSPGPVVQLFPAYNHGKWGKRRENPTKVKVGSQKLDKQLDFERQNLGGNPSKRNPDGNVLENSRA